jgi:hypothetical protein
MSMCSFVDVEIPHDSNTLVTTGFKFMGITYAVVTSKTMVLCDLFEDYETMLFIDGRSVAFPSEIASQPCRYESTGEANVGHWWFVKQIKRVLVNQARSLI